MVNEILTKLTPHTPYPWRGRGLSDCGILNLRPILKRLVATRCVVGPGNKKPDHCWPGFWLEYRSGGFAPLD